MTKRRKREEFAQQSWQQRQSSGSNLSATNEIRSVSNKSPMLLIDENCINSNNNVESSSGQIYVKEKAKKDKANGVGSTRYLVALLGLAIATVNCYAQATFCIAIVEMVLPPDFVIDDESTTVMKVEAGKSGATTTSASALVADQSCPIEYRYKDYYDSWRFPSIGTNTSSIAPTTPQISGNLIDLSNRFDWDASRQGLLLGAFAIGTAPLQVLGGRLAEIYGAKWVLLAGCIGTAITNLTIPFLAHFSFALLIVNRIVMGISQAGMEPGLMCLLAEWLVPAETGFFISMLMFAICIGFFLGSLCSSFLLGLGYGWSIAYYAAGGINLLMAVVWLLFASSRPGESKLISSEELEYIEKAQSSGSKSPAQQPDGWKDKNLLHQQHQGSQIMTHESIKQLAPEKAPNAARQHQAPWLNIFSTPSVWAFVICKISIRWCADVLSIELPTYLANVLHLSIKLNGFVNSVSSALFAIFSFISGYLVNEILNRNNRLVSEGGSQKAGLSKTSIRKLSQSIASFGSAIALFLMTRYDCNILFSMSMLLVLSCCLVMGTGGELQIPYDMTPRYPGTLHGVACTLSVSGWLAPPLIGLILGDQPSSRYRWSIVWYLTAAINLIGGLVFVLFADASPRDFDRLSASPNNDQAQRPSREPSSPPPSSSFAPPSTAHPAPGHHQVESKSQLLHSGYFNMACKSSEDSPPLGQRGSQTTCDPMTTAERRQSPQQKTVNAYQDLNNNNSSSINNSTQHRPYFDRELIRVRQLAESCIARPPGYLVGMETIAGQSAIIIPYQTSSTCCLSECHGCEADQPNVLQLLWARIWRRRRKEMTLISDGPAATERLTSTAAAAELHVANIDQQLEDAPAKVMPPAELESGKAEVSMVTGNTITHL